MIWLAGCSTSKNSDPGVAGQVYHDITARNNAYFNGDLKLKTIQKNIAESYKDDFDELLAIYPQRDPESAQTYASELDDVIKKASMAIRLHEPSKWTDNSYRLVGTSYFLKGDYETALETFQYISTEFKEEQLEEKVSSSQKKKKKKKKKPAKKKKKKKKKKKGKPQTALQIKQEKAEQVEKVSSEKKDAKTGQPAKDKNEEDKNESFLNFLKHKPTRPDALIWLVDTYTEMAKYKEAEAVVTIIEAEKKFPRKLKKDLEISKANLYLKNGALEKATRPLTSIIAHTKKKRQKTRYLYILGQVYERLNNHSNSVYNYRQVLKTRPTYEMEFNSKMSIARVSGKDNSISKSEIIELLTKLIKDSKNDEFYDQIYFALAELALQSGDKKGAITYLNKSVQTSTTNISQKAKSYLSLADIYFEDESYQNAQLYYDSTLTLLDNSNERYEELDLLNITLKDLVDQINKINTQDSLQYLASLSDNERERAINDIIRKQKQKNVVTDSDQHFNFQNNQNAPNQDSQTSGSWYFYNTAAKGQGFNDFVKKWGTRKLEDNWRRSDKSTVMEDAEDDAIQDTTMAGIDGELDKDAFLASLPISDEAMEKSNQILIQAYYTLANLYKNDLKDDVKAIENFETLLKRFPDNKFLVETYYNLYIIYKDKNNQDKANYYKNRLIKEFPESPFAKFMTDPNYLAATEQEDKKISNYYDYTYRLYLQNRIDETLGRIAAADSMFKDNHTFRPKFALLEAFAIGKSQDLPGYISALQRVTANFPNDEVKIKAEEILTYLDQLENTEYELQINASQYEFDADATHFFLASYSGKGINSNDLINKIASYNDLNRSLEDLKVNSLVLNEKVNLILVKSFVNHKIATNYYNAITAGQTFENFNTDDLQLFTISDSNFNKMINNRELDSYTQFFKTKYVK